MITYIVRRLLQMIPVLIGATFLLFVLVYALPGQPWEGRCGERPCDAAYIEKFKQDYNLDKPILVQYVMYLGKLLQGDLGVNFYQNQVSAELAQRFPTTFTLAIMAILMEIVIGITLGVIAGITKGKLPDLLITILTLVLISMPVFVIGGLFQMTLGLKLQLFPVTAQNGPASPELIYSLVMPAMVLACLQIAYITRLTRTSLVENLRADYVRTAKAKGLSRNRTVGVHTLRNSLVPVVTQIGIDLGVLMGGAIVTERIFNINGIGFFIFRSIDQQDGVSVVGAVTVLVLIYLLANLIVDVLYGFLDPRISHD
ncbi:ABC transporter permease [Enemella dayhoffiae]|uniref:ABC transporter permease n=1 Tax=Enemella dayhoffiae TaxID=2016507 RepID=A0A255H444_9ACTN|nr:ABC transporter permease [Enemella dayhoffiae]OYO22427.1 ABC transporter permease [Enemella dayhoffiae]